MEVGFLCDKGADLGETIKKDPVWSPCIMELPANFMHEVKQFLDTQYPDQWRRGFVTLAIIRSDPYRFLT
jgi:hypothetical protein